MRFIIVLITAFMFLANSYVVSAWAKPCMAFDSGHQSADQIVTDISAEKTPCPMQKNSEIKTSENNSSDKNHCNGLCLCFYTSIQQIPVLEKLNNLTVQDSKSGYIISQTSTFISHSLRPPHEPPKMLL